MSTTTEFDADADGFFCSGRRPPRIHQQVNLLLYYLVQPFHKFIENLMLILFLVCMLTMLVAVHRASC